MELVDVYDLRRRMTGKVLLREDVFKNLADDERILLVHTCVFNSDGRMLIQRRQKTKEHYPGCWDVSAGGFVLAGEKSLDAAVREIKEELGMELSEKSLAFICCQPFGRVLDDFYNAYMDVDILTLHLQESEVLDVAWADEGRILQMIRNGQFVDYAEELISRVFDEARLRWLGSCWL